jgi:hypothetical protein
VTALLRESRCRDALPDDRVPDDRVPDDRVPGGVGQVDVVGVAVTTCLRTPYVPPANTSSTLSDRRQSPTGRGHRAGVSRSGGTPRNGGCCRMHFKRHN